jgi:transposase-like protein
VSEEKATGAEVHPVKPLFSVSWSNGKVQVTVVPNVTAETLIDFTVKTVRRGIGYIDKFKSYNSLMFCGYCHLKIDHTKKFSSGKVYINGLEGFWSWAKERLIKLGDEAFLERLEQLAGRVLRPQKPDRKREVK